MNRILSSLGLVLLLSITFIACNTSSKKQLSESQIDSVRTTFKMAQDSLQFAWKSMIEDDDLKMADIKRLIEEMQNTGQYEQSKLDSLKTDLQNLIVSRYDQQSMATSESIDAYDYATADLINKVFLYAKTKTAFEEYSIMHILESDIAQAQERVLYYRINYDSWAKLINLSLSENKEYLTLDASNSNSLPLFELSE